MESRSAFPPLPVTRGLPYLDEIGLQLYTLRNPIKQDLGKTIREVAEIGYKQVESYGFPSPQSLELITQSRERGMEVNSSHFNWDCVLHPEKKGVQPFGEVLETARKHKLTDLVVPYLHGADGRTSRPTKRPPRLSTRERPWPRKPVSGYPITTMPLSFSP